MTDTKPLPPLPDPWRTSPRALPDPWPDVVVEILRETLGACDQCCTQATDGDLCERCHEVFARVADCLRPYVTRVAEARQEAAL